MEDNNSLKQKTISGLIWKFSERSVAQIINFVVSIVLARLLLPEDYGIVALVSVFITICDKLVVSGFATALIQKKDADNLDFSTVFHFSTVVSLILYAVLYFSAPLLADFYSAYNRELLISVIRMMGLQVILTSVNSVQNAYVSRQMQFRKFFWSTLGATILSGVIGIWMAYADMGVWALVAQNFIKYFVGIIVLWFTVRWRPELKFSIQRLKTLYSYGWKILVASMVKVLYTDLRSLVIGKFYSADDLAFYNKGQSFPQLVDSNVAGTIESVMFTSIAKKQSDKSAMLQMLRRTMRITTYIVAPLLTGLAATSTQVITILLTEKWLESVIYMQILSFSFIFRIIEVLNLQAIKATGRSDIALKVEILKKIIGISLLIIAIPFGVKAIAISMLIDSVLSAIVDMIPNKKLLGYSILQQIKDMAPSFIMSAIMFAVVWALSFLSINIYLLTVIQVAVGIAIYIALSAIFKVDSFKYIINIVKSKIKR